MTDRPVVPHLSEDDAALLETLNPDLARLLFPDQSSQAFTITAVYPHFEGAAGNTARDIEGSAAAHSVVEAGVEGRAPTHRTSFSLAQVEEFHELYHLAEEAIGADRLEILLNDRAVPMTRELWLPLIWSLRW